MKKKDFINFYDLKALKEMNNKSYNPGFPVTDIEIPSRVCLQGNSGSGKTSILMNYIYKTNDTWAHIYIVTKSSEPLYDYLEKQLKYKNIISPIAVTVDGMVSDVTAVCEKIVNPNPI